MLFFATWDLLNLDAMMFTQVVTYFWLVIAGISAWGYSSSDLTSKNWFRSYVISTGAVLVIVLMRLVQILHSYITHYLLRGADFRIWFVLIPFFLLILVIAIGVFRMRTYFEATLQRSVSRAEMLALTLIAAGIGTFIGFLLEILVLAGIPPM